ncbi:MAG: glycosyltransferase [Nitrososphaerales archaeon]
MSAGLFLKIIQVGKVKLIYDCREYTPSEYGQFYGFTLGMAIGAVEQIFVKFVDAIITVCVPLKNYLCRISRCPVVVLYNTIYRSDVPIEGKEACRKQLNLDGLVVSFVGVVRRSAALKELIEAARELERRGNRNINFLIVGSGPDYNEIRSFAKGLEHRIRFAPQVSHDQALKFVIASDLTYAVYRSAEARTLNKKQMLISENNRVAMPWKMFESMACGTPILVIENSSAWEFVKELGFGLSVRSGTSAEIVEKLEYAANNSNYLIKMASVARSQFLSSQNWDEMSKILVSLSDRLLNEKQTTKVQS